MGRGCIGHSSASNLIDAAQGYQHYWIHVDRHTSHVTEQTPSIISEIGLNWSNALPSNPHNIIAS